MPQNTSVASALELHRLSSDVAYLCLLDIEIINRDTGITVATKKLVRNPEPVIFRGETYEAAMFDISIKEEVGKVAEVSLSLVDYTQDIQARMEAYGGAIGSNVTFMIVNSAQLDDEPDEIEFFQIVGASSKGYRHEFTLGAENALRQTFPRRRQAKDFCQARFKDPATCKYVGAATSCDLTLKGSNGCAVKNNTINFHAYMGINTNGFRYS